MAMYRLKMCLQFSEYWEWRCQNRQVRLSLNAVVEALGDRAIKSDNPLVSSKIDFADFLAFVVPP
jgi:hypothetical protein